jgi:hypothetical protein
MLAKCPSTPIMILKKEVSREYAAGTKLHASNYPVYEKRRALTGTDMTIADFALCFSFV